MYAIFRKTLYDFRWTFIWFLGITSGYVAMIASFYPTIQESAEQFVKLLDTYPEGLREAFGISAESLTTFGGFISVEYFSFMFIIVLSVFMFILATSTVAGEVDRGTAEFTFTLPAKRSAILAGKLLASYCYVLGVVLAVLFTVGVAGHLVNAPLEVASLAKFFVVVAALAMFILGFGTLFSSLLRSKGLANAASGGFLGVSYALHIIHGVTDRADAAYVFSFFKYYGNAETILTTGHVAWNSVLTLLLIGASAMIICFLIAGERDI